jgi:hypothetical protein
MNLKTKCSTANIDAHKIFDALLIEYIRLHFTIDDWHALYADSEKHFNLIRDTAQGFFGPLRRMMLESIILQITRMMETDNGNNKQLSLHKLAPLVVDHSRKKTFKRLKNKATHASKVCDSWRDNIIAHAALKHFVPTDGTKLESIKWKDMQECRDAIWAVLEYTHASFSPNVQLLRCFLRDHPGASGLIEHLKQSKKFTELNIARHDDMFDFTKWEGWGDWF